MQISNGIYVGRPSTSAPTLVVYNISTPISMAYPSVSIICNDNQVGYHYVNNAGPYTTTQSIVDALNADAGTSSFGTYLKTGNTSIQLSIPASVVNELCPGGVITMIIEAD